MQPSPFTLRLPLPRLPKFHTPRVSALRPICLLSNEFFPHRGGIATYSEEVARAASELGRYVEVWGPDNPTAIARAWPFRYRPIRFEGTQNLTCQLKLAASMIDQRRHLRRSIVHLADPGAILAMTYLHAFRTFRPAETVLTFHGSEILRFSENPALRLLIEPLVRRATRITTPSSYSRDLLEQHFPSAAKRTLVTPLSGRRSVLSARSGPKKPADKIVILTVARIHPRKGQHHVIEALSRLPAALRGRIEYWIVGTGSKEAYDERLQAAASECGFPVRFHGEVPDDSLGAYYAAADIFALTSIEHRNSVEGFGIVYLEAGSHGLPSVAHATGGVAEAVRDGQSGLLVPTGDGPALTQAFTRLIECSKLRAELGAGGRSWAARHSWTRVAQALYGGPEGTEAFTRDNPAPKPSAAPVLPRLAAAVGH